MTATLTTAELDQVHEILVSQLDVAKEQIQPEAQLQADLGADSLDLVEIAMKVEEQFGVTLPDEHVEEVLTVDDLCLALTRALGRD